MLHSTRLFWDFCSCPRLTDSQFLLPRLPLPSSRPVPQTRLLLLSVLLPMTWDCTLSLRLQLPLWDLLPVQETPSRRMVVKPSLSTSWLPETQLVPTLSLLEDQRRPERLTDTLVWVHTSTRLQRSCLRVESSRELEVEGDREVSRFEAFGFLIFSFSFALHLLRGLRFSVSNTFSFSIGKY